MQKPETPWRRRVPQRTADRRSDSVRHGTSGSALASSSLGAALLVLNDLMMLQPSLLLLPGGHNELYLIAAVLIAGYSTWFFGWFDRTR